MTCSNRTELDPTTDCVHTHTKEIFTRINTHTCTDLHRHRYIYTHARRQFIRHRVAPSGTPSARFCRCILSVLNYRVITLPPLPATRRPTCGRHLLNNNNNNNHIIRHRRHCSPRPTRLHLYVLCII